MTAKRVMVIGLDCVPPALVFDRLRPVMPQLSSLMRAGTWGTLRSTVPPITVPAWVCMLSGRDPGQLGLYGFRNRQRGSYHLKLIDSRHLRYPMLWDLLGAAGKRVAVLFVPPSYPPLPVRGQMVSCFLTPGPDRPHTFPPSLQAELEQRFGPLIVDVEDFRGPGRADLPGRLRKMAEQHFGIAEYIWQTHQPDLLIMVEMGPDRLHHAFWQYLDPAHSQYQPNTPYEDECRCYYELLDQRIGRMVRLAGEGTAVLVVSDHGARALHGGICLNEFLIEHDYLALKRYPDTVTPLAELQVDWGRTRAWGEGGYYGRVFINLAGREPQGVVAERNYPAERARLAELIRSIEGPDSETLDNLVLAPERCYRQLNGFPPDLYAFFGDLAFRSVGSVGHGCVHLPAGGQGLDGCNHHWDGIFVLSGGGSPSRGQVPGYRIYDVASTVLGLMDVPIPPGLLGVDRSR